MNSNYSEDCTNSSLNDSSINSTVIEKPTGQETYPFLIFFVVFTVCGVTLNFVNLVYICFKTEIKRPTNYLTANLLFVSLLYMVFLSIRILGNEIELWSYKKYYLCQISGFINRLPREIISLTTMAISIERLRMASNPLLKTTRTQNIKKLLMIWIVSIFLTFPLCFTRDYDAEKLSYYKCKRILLFQRKELSITYGCVGLVFGYLVPTFVFAFEITKMDGKMKFLRWSMTSMKRRSRQGHPMYYLYRVSVIRKIRLLRTAMVFTSIFLTCWLPLGIFQTILDLPEELLTPEIDDLAKSGWNIFRVIIYIVICTHPLLLTYLTYEMKA